MRCGRYLQDTLAVNACRHMRRLLATQGSAVTPSSEDRTEAQPKYLHGKRVNFISIYMLSTNFDGFSEPGNFYGLCIGYFVSSLLFVLFVLEGNRRSR